MSGFKVVAVIQREKCAIFLFYFILFCSVWIFKAKMTHCYGKRSVDRNLATQLGYVIKTSLPLHASAICNFVYFWMDGSIQSSQNTETESIERRMEYLKLTSSAFLWRKIFYPIPLTWEIIIGLNSITAFLKCYVITYRRNPRSTSIVIDYLSCFYGVIGSHRMRLSIKLAKPRLPTYSGPFRMQASSANHI